jgi:hypothetical protein
MCQSLENKIQTIVNLQTARSLNKVKRNILHVLKTTHAQHYCALKGKMKVKETANKIMMKYLMGVRKQRFPNIAMNAFCYQNFKLNIHGGGAVTKMIEAYLNSRKNT